MYELRWDTVSATCQDFIDGNCILSMLFIQQGASEDEDDSDDEVASDTRHFSVHGVCFCPKTISHRVRRSVKYCGYMLNY